MSVRPPHSQQLGIVRKIVDQAGIFFVEFFHILALFAIGGATVWAALYAFVGMFDKPHASVEDLLLLFIYLEIGAMVGIYFKTAHLPVRFLLYVAITALTRLMIGYIDLLHKPMAGAGHGAHPEPGWGIIFIAVAILLLAISEIVIRFGKCRFPLDTEVPEISDRPGNLEKPDAKKTGAKQAAPAAEAPPAAEPRA